MYTAPHVPVHPQAAEKGEADIDEVKYDSDRFEKTEEVEADGHCV